MPPPKLPVPLDIEPMEAELRDELPLGDGWLYEPKWDGFRCLAFRSGGDVDLRSKAGKPLSRYFPDVVEAILEVPADRFVLDGEIVIPVGGSLSFDDLLLRIHPAASRVKKLAAAHPGVFIAFDLLADARGKDLRKKVLRERRGALERFAARLLAHAERVRLSPATEEVKIARKWLAAGRGGLDGVMAKRLDLPYQAGARTGMVKVKRLRSADCVVGGFRWTRSGDRVASLLLGLYDDDGKLHHVGFCAALTDARRREADERLPPLRGGDGFTGRAPQGHSRWRKEGSGDWEPVRPGVVVEVQYDHFTSGRFRHGTRFLRWRPDKPPERCTLDQVAKEGTSAMRML
jgi:ATP-dependent DNA ligase